MNLLANRTRESNAPASGGRRERRRLVEQDHSTAHRAELHLMRGLLLDAAALVATGWAQHCWFVTVGLGGERRRVGPLNLHDLPGRTVTEVCLVGAIVQAGGGPGSAGSQPTRRALDLTWATLNAEPVRWCPAPAVRVAHVRDLTHWNDAPVRTAGDVSQLLAGAAQVLASDLQEAGTTRQR